MSEISIFSDPPILKRSQPPIGNAPFIHYNLESDLRIPDTDAGKALLLQALTALEHEQLKLMDDIRNRNSLVNH